jgi:hypothetical protein
MSEKSRPKFSARNSLPNGDFLTFAVWQGKTDPSAEVFSIQLRHKEGDLWETTGRIAIYRTADGQYSKLPERQT